MTRVAFVHFDASHCRRKTAAAAADPAPLNLAKARSILNATHERERFSFPFTLAFFFFC